MIPLSLSSLGREMTIKALGGKQEVKNFIESLGFSFGAKVVVLSVINGNVIVRIKDTRIAIIHEMAGKILVN